MAIAPTGAIYKSLVFDGEDSRNYGVYITGQAVYNAPGRDVEMVEIPGRNGSFALDKGRFQNIEVSYPAGIFADNEADFAEAISDFRNFLCSRRGYVRLTDEYNPNEYRMAVYKSGLEVSPAQLKAGEFEIVFDCKPQRFLTSGENHITIGEWRDMKTASGTISSFEAVEGDGVKSFVVDIEPIQSGSGTPSPSNIRPISGWDSITAISTGKNLLPYPYANSSGTSGGITYAVNDDGSVTFNGTATSNVWYNFAIDGVPSSVTLKAGNYVINVNGGSANPLITGMSVTANVRVGSTNKYSATLNSTTQSTNFTPEEDGILRCYVAIASGTAVDNMTIKPMIRLVSETDDIYEQYQGNTYTATLGQTVYGGTLDVVSGELTVTHGYIASYSGETLPSTWISDRDEYSSGTTPTTGAQVVYELATPTTSTLTAQEVSVLVGMNYAWANSGDVTVKYGTSPNVLVNPTLFEAQPMLEVEGYGNIQFNGYEITIVNATFGDVTIAESTYLPENKTITIPPQYIKSGDKIYIQGFKTLNEFQWIGASHSFHMTQSPTPVNTATGAESAWIYSPAQGATVYPRFFVINTTFPTIEITQGTDSTFTNVLTIPNLIVTENWTDTYTITIKFTSQITYSATNNTIAFDFTFSMQGDNIPDPKYELDSYYNGYSTRFEEIVISSTISLLGNPTYIDCDIGEAYLIRNEQAAPLNKYIDLGSDLPCLAVGSNEFTYDNTITDLKVIPRWWKV